ncbi:MAG: L-aspartate oxidase [Actinobacteria bacterium]|uniref:L-aspartate oxidase n=1 Tax=freshwater metagenome TaxID=449393 RepID=A0A6J7D7P7_9ZZZZ|nr:L-aspartate oxidase [Actinomycetota bacterium]MSX24781.1 L-aspartate oxidase [Actinomycetota bacterium]MSY46187.1 L-aspartate oxidase [Actinomycetota bacterium]MSY56811.1 L-aspartate oxidase [Actinomycetota bacterium]MTB00486.1 L-aspartate oxidase [Actinomycetota bacterium]
MKLLAPKPGWTARADVIVVGSGVAGLTTALQIRTFGLSVLLVTKARVDAGSTKWAQGGIAAALGPGDSPDQHEKDTLVAGAGLCDFDAVKVLVSEGPEAVRKLIARGAVFDKEATGEIALTREGGHLRNRILHAGGDATGAEVSRALLAAVRNDPDIEVVEHALVLDALKNESGAVCGVTLHVIGAGTRDGVGQAIGRAVVLATGGLGQVFAQTTNPPVSTGDGVALALRAGAQVADVEFIQFHPTVLWLGDGSKGQQPLISEAVRGEGAYLLDDAGERFMVGLHPLAELAPRDVVAIAIMRRMNETGAHHVWLDVRHIEGFTDRFPTIYASCLAHGIDPLRDLIPVAPASHYASGGARVDLNGHTSVKGLYACGETACSGVHGANRLASNSLLEGLVFSARIAADIAKNLPEFTEPIHEVDSSFLIEPQARKHLQSSMSRGAGVLRSAHSLEETEKELAIVATSTSTNPCVEAWETSNLLQLAQAIVRSALEREETRGSHWREDFPETSPQWSKRILQHLEKDGTWNSTLQEVAN